MQKEEELEYRSTIFSCVMLLWDPVLCYKVFVLVEIVIVWWFCRSTAAVDFE